MITTLNEVTVFAPASSANVAVGFDILGFAVQGLGDTVTLTKNTTSQLKITSAPGVPGDINKNTATVALQAMRSGLKLEQGFDVAIKKSIPLSSGLGGSAASAVAAVVALNRFLSQPLSLEELSVFALAGEEAACGVRHGDNVIPSLLGGMTLIQSLEPLQSISLPLMPLAVVLVHPHLRVNTRDARAVIKSTVSLADFTQQNARLAAFISALYEKNYARLQSACIDDLIEPMRAHLIPGFYEVKAAAYQQGALACSISGSGPTMFALVESKQQARGVAQQMQKAFKSNGILSDVWVTTIAKQGAEVIHEH